MIQDEFGWIHFKGDIPFIRKGVINFLKFSIRKKLNYPKGKNISKIIESIEKKGWDAKLAYQPQRGVLGYSKELDTHQVLHGKHRLAALKYLNYYGKIPDSLVIDYPVISYEWGSWAQFTQYPGTKCDCANLWKN